MLLAGTTASFSWFRLVFSPLHTISTNCCGELNAFSFSSTTKLIPSLRLTITTVANCLSSQGYRCQNMWSFWATYPLAIFITAMPLSGSNRQTCENTCSRLSSVKSNYWFCRRKSSLVTFERTSCGCNPSGLAYHISSLTN